TPACTTATLPGHCDGLSSGTNGVCTPNGTQQADSICGQDEGKAYDAGKMCGTGMTCLTFTQDAVKGLCLTLVPSCTPTTACTTGYTCLELTGGQGACAEDCSTAATVCTSNGKNCSQVTSTQTVCTPAGSKTFSQVCNSSDLCAPGLTCLSAQDAPSGFCTPVCGGSNPACPTTPAGATCQAVTSTNSFCMFSCTQPNPTCPTGLTCQAMASGSLCLAP
ncbi:MAG: hypothetical protein KAI47_06715, partial [Deltaproteobacteria bacterium]|nr:hypothetical protein [Deltaproteobacteria bacterium]